MSEIEVYTIFDFAEIQNQKRVPLSSMERAKRKGKFPYYGASGIIDYVNNFLFDGQYVLISEDGENLKSRKTPVAFEAKGQFWVNNHAHIIKGRKNFHNKLLVYYFQNLDLNPYLTGAVQPKLNKEQLLSIPIILPKSESVQKSIVETLSSLDDKIDLLHRQNKTLEQLAETVFRQWFVEEAEENWEVTAFKKIGKVVTGKTPSTGNKEFWGTEIPFITPTDFKNFGKYISSSDRFLTTQGKESVKNTFLPKATILVTCIGSDMGKVAITLNSCVTNQQINSLIINDNFSYPEYVYQYLKSIYSLLRSMASGGSTMPIINKSEFENIEIPMPPEDILVKYENVTFSFNNKILNNTTQIRTLTQLRDTLLPKLMSGEVRVM